MSFQTGDQVRVKFSGTLEGTVQGASVNDNAEFFYLVEYTDHTGEVTRRYFKVDELEAAV